MEASISSSTYMRLEHGKSEHKDVVVINWCLGNTCNFSCTYCPDFLHNGSSPWPDPEIVIKFIDRVIAHYAGKKIYFEFTGGEVALWKDLSKVLEHLRANDCKVGIISNGSRSIEFFKKIADKIDHICLSFHPEKGNQELFLKVVELFSNRIRTHVNIMMKPDAFEDCFHFSNRVVEIPNISIALQPLMEGLNGAMMKYSDLEMEILETQDELLGSLIQYDKEFEHYRGGMVMVSGNGDRKEVAPHKFIATQQNNWKGWDCHIGLEQIVVDMDGTIFRGWCKVGGKIGNINDTSFKLPTRAINCSKSSCHCNLDIMATKEKPELMRDPFKQIRAALHA